MNTRSTFRSMLAVLVASAPAGLPGAQTAVGSTPGSADGDVRPALPAPPAGGKPIPNLGMHQMKKDGPLFSGAVPLPPGTVPPQSPAPLGAIVGSLYLPDAGPSYAFASDHELPLDAWFANSDPSGSLDESALDANGDPIHFNLHWPQSEPDDQFFWLRDEGIDPSSPADDLEQILDQIVATGDKARIQEALDILLGTNVSGALANKAYLGMELLKIYGRRDNRTYDEETRNVEVTQLWYGTEIYTDANMVKVPMHGDYTITWKLRGLGDPGPNNEFAFPIDEFTAMPMKKVANANFWYRNSWIWKWFDAVDPRPGDARRFSLENLFALHTGSAAAPSYDQLNPGDPRYWLHADRKLDLGSYVGGKGDLQDLGRWHALDLDQDGRIGGYLVDGTYTGLPHDPATNPEAQFNAYGNSEYAVPLLDWSQGPYTVPYFGYDSSFTTIRKGQGIDLTVRYAQGLSQAGLYVWGWRVHPPRINWIETYSDGEYLPSGAPKDWRFGHKWDEVAALGLAAIGDHAPELRIHDALLAFQASAGGPGDVAAFEAAVGGMMKHVRDRRGLPPTPGVADFPDPTSDLNVLYTNLDMYGDRDRISASGKLSWDAGDVIKITIHNDENFTRFFRVVDFGTTDYQYVGTDMGLFDWKPVFGFPQLAAGGWSTLFFAQGFDPAFWSGTAVGAMGGNPFFVDPLENDPSAFWPAGQRDLFHAYQSLSGFSGPGFHNVVEGQYTTWGNDLLAGKPTGDPDIWKYSYGKPIPPNTTLTFHVEMPRAQALNNGAMYMFDPQFHHAAIFTNHPRSELQPEGLGD